MSAGLRFSSGLMLFGLMILLAGGCQTTERELISGDPPRLRPLDNLERTGDLAHRDPFPAYNVEPHDGRGRIFLVALGSDIANFAQEVANQRETWRKAGYSDKQIVCYYVKPPEEDYKADREQFDALREQLADMYIAAPNVIGQHLAAAADQEPGFIYLYMTSHGGGPRTFWMSPKDMEKPDERYLLDEFPQTDDHFLASGATETGTVNFAMKLHAAANGARPADLFLTPDVVRDWIMKFPASTQKVVVLQGCYSGGYLRRDPDYKSASDVTLAEVPNLIAVSAARHDRPSFGCDPGSDQTIFGEIWGDNLATHLATGDIEWETMFQEVKAGIDEREHEMDFAIKHRSRPQILVTADQPQ